MPNYWEQKAVKDEEQEAKDAFEKKWAEGIGDKHLDPEANYCKDIMDRAKRGVIDRQQRSVQLANGVWTFEWVEVIDPTLKELYGSHHKATFASTDTCDAMIDPKFPKINDEEIMDHMGINLQKKELKTFIRMLQLTKKFIETRDAMCSQHSRDYHGHEYNGEFRDVKSWGLY